MLKAKSLFHGIILESTHGFPNICFNRQGRTRPTESPYEQNNCAQGCFGSTLVLLGSGLSIYYRFVGTHSTS